MTPLIISLYYCQSTGLVDFTEIDAFIAKLRLHPNGVQGALFPILQVSDIVWDHVIQKKFILSPDDIECDQDPLPYPGVCVYIHILKDTCVYINFSDSRQLNFMSHQELVPLFSLMLSPHGEPFLLRAGL